MERDPIQLENMHPSGLKQPSKLPTMSFTANIGRTLHETSQSDLNARAINYNTSMPPPPTGSIKHKLNGLSEPPPKRKTLAERAGEPLQQFSRSQAPSSRLKRPDSAAEGYHARTISGSNNIPRPASGISGPPSSAVPRPSSRQQGLRNNGGSRQPAAVPPQAIPQNDEDEGETGISGKRKGTYKPFHNSSQHITVRKSSSTLGLRNVSSMSSCTDMSSRSQHSGVDVCDLLSLPKRQVCTSTCSSTEQIPEHRRLRPTTSSFDTNYSDEKCRRSIRSDSLVKCFETLRLGPSSSDVTQYQHQPKSVCRPRTSLEAMHEQDSPSKIPKPPYTSSLRPTQSLQSLRTPKSSKFSVPQFQHDPTPGSTVRRKKKKKEPPIFLTKEKLTSTAAWDTKGRLEDMEVLYAQLHAQFSAAADSKSMLEESLGLYKSRVQELSQDNKELSASNHNLSSDLERARNDLHTITSDLRQARRDHERDVQEMERKHERTLSDMNHKQEREEQKRERDLERITHQGKRDRSETRRELEKQKDDALAELTTQHWDEIEELKTQHQSRVIKLQTELEQLHRSDESRAAESAVEVQVLRESIARFEEQVETAKSTMAALRSQIAASEARNTSLEQERTTLVSKTHFLEGNQEAQSLEFTSMSQRLQDAIDARNSAFETLRKEEMLRRKLNATILELRGNIRVFARLRPLLQGEGEPATVEYPDAQALDGGREMVVLGPTVLSATGKERREKHEYAFDRVFNPGTANSQVFDDCRDLIQSVVDGYNVSILSYGQTGSGKTYGMSGPEGIIPSSISLLLAEMRRLKEKDWDYVVEASFLEVYNESLNDLLGDAKTWDEVEDFNASVRGKKKEKHEIHHDASTGKTTVTNLTAVTLWPPPENEGSWPPPAAMDTCSDGDNYTEQAATQLLETAAKNRRVAATKANERSSRSHSVFILTLKGRCATTSESSEGVLNLVDLAGSERLKQSGAEGNRMKETQAINKSLSALGDVIAALGMKKSDESHIPYRNSKLTYLLQSSLGGTTAGKSSRTLMLLHLSPLMVHWQESRSSLMFGSKVQGTHIGAAKKR